MKTSHKGMKITESDWTAFLGHASVTLDAFEFPRRTAKKLLGSFSA